MALTQKCDERQRERRTIWKASAVRASECARKPQTSSSKKKAVSMAIIILMRVLLESAILEPMAGEVLWLVEAAQSCRT